MGKSKTGRLRLQKIEPVRFPGAKKKSRSLSPVRGSGGLPTRDVIAEMKRISKQDLFVAQ